jgi:hypothetical protein
MSLYVLESKFLAVSPRLDEKDSVLHIYNANVIRLLTLFLHLRHVQIDFKKRIVQIDERWFWLYTQTRQIPFDFISHLDYDFADLATSFGFCMEANDTVEKFTITLVSKSDEKYELCAFRGEGAVTNGLGGVLLGGDSVEDFMGTQEGDSRQFVTRLSKRLGVPIGREYDFSEITQLCKSCGQQAPKSMSHCLYCGARL